MAKTNLSNKALFVERGYGQVEPNHLSAQRTGQIYAQLPADPNISVLENGQFVKYDYENGVVNFTGAGEWMLVFNEVKIYRDWETECDFAMKKSNYIARVYSPIDGTARQQLTDARNYGAQTGQNAPQQIGGYEEGVASGTVNVRSQLAEGDPYDPFTTMNPFQAEWDYKGPMAMKPDTTMVPRVFKTNVGDIYTTNCVAETQLAIGNVLVVGDDGYLTLTPGSNAGDMKWQVVKLYDLGDHQKAVKLMRIA